MNEENRDECVGVKKHKMSDEKKCFSRPKVRFSRCAESASDTGASEKPKIRSIVTVKPSIKIVKGPLSSSGEQTNLRYSMGDAPNDVGLCPLKTSSSCAPRLTEIILTPENSSSKGKNLSDRGETCKSSGVECGKSNCAKTSKQKSKEPIWRSKLCENRLDKENIAQSGYSKENVLRAARDAPQRRRIDEGTTRGRSCLKKSEISEKKVKKGESKSVAIGPTMPRMKFSRDRSKSAPAKKTILSDATAIPSRVYVGPGIVRLRPPLRSRSEILSGDKLARPEYNSIVNTMKKLRDAREERIAEDMEHLPAVYRRLVNGKVSSALDFGANEAIYRDLVDLTIDEKQLPSRLTRSKDPEPRQRDLVPKLSDFFVPRNDEEYRITVFARPPSPRVLDSSNPYKVSDRIFSWKESLDYDH